jgi:hypothetical protein
MKTLTKKNSSCNLPALIWHLSFFNLYSLVSMKLPRWRIPLLPLVLLCAITLHAKQFPINTSRSTEAWPRSEKKPASEHLNHPHKTLGYFRLGSARRLLNLSLSVDDNPLVSLTRSSSSNEDGGLPSKLDKHFSHTCFKCTGSVVQSESS